MVLAMAHSPMHVSSIPASSEMSAKTASAGYVQFVSAPLFSELGLELRKRRFLVACVPAEGPDAQCGGLGKAIELAVESSLSMRGALPPQPCAQPELQHQIRDQVWRARLLSLEGLVLLFPSLSAFANGHHELSDADAQALGAWLHAAEREPCVLLFSESDRELKMRVSVPLAELAAPPRAAPQSLQAEPEAISDTPPAAEASDETPHQDLAELTAESTPPNIDSIQEDFIPEAGQEQLQSSAHSDEIEVEIAADENDSIPPAPERRPEPVAPPAKAADAASLRRSTERILGASERRTFAMELEAARGPKPMRTILDLFMTRYTPLLSALNQGERDGFVRAAVDNFRSNFEHSYRESFASMRVTGKRPPMVFDAPDVAAKIARLNGARAVRLLLVDAMSFDLGERMNALLKERIGTHSICVDQALLWSALPTVTAQQLALLARGVDGLREDPEAKGDEHEIARGRAVTTIRRERAGSREILKLDCVEARIRAPGGDYAGRMGAMAEELSQIVAKCLESQSPRTLVFVFGDHGFRIPAAEGGAAALAFSQGGASPEEVLVPGYAWLTGSIH